MPPSFSAIIKQNQEYATCAAAKNPVAVFVGATSGVGEHTAYAFARHTASPTIYIVGRNAAAGARVLARLREENPRARSRFLQHDLTLLAEADAMSRTIIENESKVNLLFMSPGVLSTEGRRETPEGVDTKMALNYYGRWRVVENLLPLVLNASAQDQDQQGLQDQGKLDQQGLQDQGKLDTSQNARVVTVLTPGNEGPVLESDLDLKTNYSLLNFNRHITEFNSLAVARFANQYPAVGFIHAGPGLVNTGITRELPWYIRYAAVPFMMLFAAPPEKAGERLFYVATNGEYRTGAHLLTGGLKSAKERVEAKGYLSKELQEKVWNHTQDIFNQAVGKQT